MFGALGGKYERRPIIKSHLPACRPGPPRRGANLGKFGTTGTSSRQMPVDASRGASLGRESAFAFTREQVGNGRKHPRKRARGRPPHVSQARLATNIAWRDGASPRAACRQWAVPSREGMEIVVTVVFFVVVGERASRVAFLLSVGCMDPCSSHGSQAGRFARRAPETGPDGVGGPDFGLFYGQSEIGTASLFFILRPSPSQRTRQNGRLF